MVFKKQFCALSSFLLLACQYPGTSDQGSFALHIDWPQATFRVQLIPSETESIQLRIRGSKGTEVEERFTRNQSGGEKRFTLDIGKKDVTVRALDAQGQTLAESESQVTILPNQVTRADIELKAVQEVIESPSPSSGSGSGGNNNSDNPTSEPPATGPRPETNPNNNRPDGNADIPPRIKELAKQINGAEALPDGRIKLPDGKIVNEEQVKNIIGNIIGNQQKPAGSILPGTVINGGGGGGGGSSFSPGIPGVLSINTLSADPTEINPGFVVRLKAEVTDANQVLQAEHYIWGCQDSAGTSCVAPVASAEDPSLAYWTAPNDANGIYKLGLALSNGGSTISPLIIQIQVSTSTQSLDVNGAQIDGGT